VVSAALCANNEAMVRAFLCFFAGGSASLLKISVGLSEFATAIVSEESPG